MNRRKLLTGGAALAVTGAVGEASWRHATGTRSAYDRYQDDLRANLAQDPSVAELIRYATLAPSGHNTQPWRITAQGSEIRITPDFLHRTPMVDPDDHHLYVSLGCLAETLAIAGTATGRPGKVETAGTGLRYIYSQSAAKPDALFQAIPKRQSTRAAFDGREIPATVLAELADAVETPDVQLSLLAERAHIDRLRDLVLAANDDQMADPDFLSELLTWLRFNPDQAMTRGDGLYAAASGMPILPTRLGRIAFDMAFTGASERTRYARLIDSTPCIAILTGKSADPASWIAVGRACQRLALTATTLGLRTSFINQPVEVARFRPDLADIAGTPGRRPDLVMRLGYGPEMPFSPRRPTGRVITK